MKTTRVGLDLEKRVFQVHGVDELGRANLGKRRSRGEVLEYFVQLPPCVVGIEACGGAH
jgi:transposase